MNVQILTQQDVVRLLPMHECIEVMDAAFRTMAKDEVVLPLRSKLWLPDRSGLLGLMPAYLGSPETIGLKVLTVFPKNHGTEYDSHQGVVMLFEVGHGCPVAILDASSITAIRTAAVSGLATRALARADAGDLAILGSGVQARSHLEAMKAVRPLHRVRVWSRTPAHGEQFARIESERLGLRIEAVPSARDAVVGADLVCTTTAATEPVLRGEWLEPGTHVNAAGACFATARELDAAAVARARLIVDRLESAMNEAGDFLLARKEGAVTDDHIAGELGQVLTGAIPGRRSEEEITLFESLGVAIEDLAAAHHVWRKAVAGSIGLSVPLMSGRLASV